jgi:hypothetical protein
MVSGFATTLWGEALVEQGSVRTGAFRVALAWEVTPLKSFVRVRTRTSGGDICWARVSGKLRFGRSLTLPSFALFMPRRWLQDSTQGASLLWRFPGLKPWAESCSPVGAGFSAVIKLSRPPGQLCEKIELFDFQPEDR